MSGLVLSAYSCSPTLDTTLCFLQNNVVIELNGLKIAEDRTFADCGRHMLTALLGLCLPPPRGAKDEYKVGVCPLLFKQ